MAYDDKKQPMEKPTKQMTDTELLVAIKDNLDILAGKIPPRIYVPYAINGKALATPSERRINFMKNLGTVAKYLTLEFDQDATVTLCIEDTERVVPWTFKANQSYVITEFVMWMNIDWVAPVTSGHVKLWASNIPPGGATQMTYAAYSGPADRGFA